MHVHTDDACGEQTYQRTDRERKGDSENLREQQKKQVTAAAADTDGPEVFCSAVDAVAGSVQEPNHRNAAEAFRNSGRLRSVPVAQDSAEGHELLEVSAKSRRDTAGAIGLQRDVVSGRLPSRLRGGNDVPERRAATISQRHEPDHPSESVGSGAARVAHGQTKSAAPVRAV